MIDEALKIKLNQFMLSYERQCAQLQYQRQNIKQNVMLSIIEMRNSKKNNPHTINNNSQLTKSTVKQKPSQNLASSKQTKFSEDKQIDIKNQYMQPQEQKVEADYEDLDRSKFHPVNSKLMQRSNVTVKSNKSNRLTNNFVNDNFEQYDERIEENPIGKAGKSNMFNNNANNASYCFAKDKNVEVTEMQNDSNLITFKQQKSALYNKGPQINQNQSSLLKNNPSKLFQAEQKQNNNLLTQSSISKKSTRPIPINNQSEMQKQLQENYSALQSNVYQRNTSKLYANSQKVLKANPSLIAVQNNPYQNDNDQLQGQQEQYPTFKRPSFQFITNMEDLRQSNPNQNDDEENVNYEDQKENSYDEEPSNYQQGEETLGKWNSKRRNNNQNNRRQPEQVEDDGFQVDDYEGEQEEDPEFGQEKPNFSDIREDQSMMVVSQLNQQPKKTPGRTQQQQRKSYLAFQINMEKSTIPSTQTMEQLKKKKILELQRKRQQRMENNSKRKMNPSEISNISKAEKKQQGNLIPGGRSTYGKRESENRDSLNKSISDKKTNDNRPKNLKGSVLKQDESCKESVFQDNRTIMTKYGDQSRVNNNRSTSPLNTIKTIQTDKRPPLSKNRKEDNIFAGESTFQRERSSQKLTADPKIVPIDRKNTFQKKSNIKIMINAITYTCLPGELNRRQRQKLIDVLEDYENEYFIFLFKEYSRKVIKGIYILDGNQQKMMRIYGDKGPSEVFPEQVHEFYRFDSGSREFKRIDGCKTFSFSIHAIDLK